jgi:chitinase
MIKNKALLGILFFITSLFSVYSCTTKNDSEPEDSKKQTARVVGYLSTDNINKMTSIQFCKLTHLNVAFANPDKEGNLIFD